MRLRERVARWLMDDAQRALVDPTQYHTPVSARQVLSEIDAGHAGRVDHETYGAMVSAVEDLGAKHGGQLTIAQVVEAKRSMDRALSEPYDSSFHEWAVIANCGNHALARFMTARANALAQSVKPGAEAALGQAFAAQS